MDGGFAGVGSIDKNGANTLIFDQNADNRLFVGDFTQTAGTTLVYADNFSAARTPLPKARFCILPAMPPSTTCGCKPAAGWICAGRDLLPPTL